MNGDVQLVFAGIDPGSLSVILLHLHWPFLVNANHRVQATIRVCEEPNAILLADSPCGLGANDPTLGASSGAAAPEEAVFDRYLIIVRFADTRSVRRGDAGHRETCATPSESLGKPPFRSSARHAGGRRNVLTMPHIAGDDPPTRRAAPTISMGLYQCSLVLGHVFGGKAKQ